MTQVPKALIRHAWSIPTLALAGSMLAFFVPATVASAGEGIRGNPCDVRDTCSSDPAKYEAHREDASIKAREYVGEMRWGTGGAPDDVYVISRTVGSRDFLTAKPCETRDDCNAGPQGWKVVRSGPAVDVRHVAHQEGRSAASGAAR
jgi:hypothetical protein